MGTLQRAEPMKLNADSLTVLRRELQLSNFSLKHDTPQCFIKCVWQKQEDRVPVLYLVYRWCFMIYFIVTIIISILNVGRENTTAIIIAKWPIYLTNWSYAVCTIQAVLATWLVTEKFIIQRRDTSRSQLMEMCCKCKIYWALNTLGLVTALTITTYYWATIFKPGIDPVDAINLLVHVFNSMFMLLDVCILAHPIRLQHFYIPFTFTIVFCIFSVVYYFSGGTDRNGNPFLYPALDWRNPGKTIAACAAGLFALLVFHILAWSISIGRVAVCEKVKQKITIKHQSSSTV